MQPDPVRHAQIIFETNGRSPGMMSEILASNITTADSEERRQYWNRVKACFESIVDRRNAVPQKETGYDEA